MNKFLITQSQRQPSRTIVYHHTDTDGYGSMMLAYLYDKTQLLIPYNYEDILPGQPRQQDKIIFIDCTPKEQFVKDNPDFNITIYDHHQQIYDKLKDYKNIVYYFDNNKCGTKIYYDEHTSLKTNYLDKIVYMINQYDLYLFKQEECEETLQILYLNEYVISNKRFINNFQQMMIEGKKLYDTQKELLFIKMKKGKVVVINNKRIIFFSKVRLSFQLQNMIRDHYTGENNVDYVVSYFVDNKNPDNKDKYIMSIRGPECLQFFQDNMQVQTQGHKDACGGSVQKKYLMNIIGGTDVSKGAE